MTDDSQVLFATALARHVDGGRLRNAFDACNRAPDLERYDRTSLSRWLSGSIPSRGDFVASLAARLDDLSIYEAWVEAQNGPSTADVKAVVTRFQGLPRGLKDDAFRQIRDNYVSTSLTIRDRFSMRVDLHDSDGHDAYRFRVKLAINWIGYLPPKAKIVFASEGGGFSDAYRPPDCIFRESIGLDQEQFARLFSSKPWQQILNYLPTDGERSKAVTHMATMDEPVVYEFQNDESDRASIMLRIEYPLPLGVPIFPILFKSYQISGPAVITLTLQSDLAHSPRAFGFLGQGVDWVVNELHKEIVLEAGASGVLIGADTGVIFYWSDGD